MARHCILSCSSCATRRQAPHSNITEVTGMESGIITARSLMVRTGGRRGGRRDPGRTVPTGITPTFADRFRGGINLEMGLAGRGCADASTRCDPAAASVFLFFASSPRQRCEARSCASSAVAFPHVAVTPGDDGASFLK
jgi:hypothetical protein